MIEQLYAKTEGPNTFWLPTNWGSKKSAIKAYPNLVYRKKRNGGVEILCARKEGDNTFWDDTGGSILEDDPSLDGCYYRIVATPDD